MNLVTICTYMHMHICIIYVYKEDEKTKKKFFNQRKKWGAPSFFRSFKKPGFNNTLREFEENSVWIPSSLPLLKLLSCPLLISMSPLLIVKFHSLRLLLLISLTLRDEREPLFKLFENELNAE